MRKPLALLMSAALLAAMAPGAPALARSRALFGSKSRYTNSSGRSVRSPGRSLLSALGSTAKCRDGSSSHSRHSSGTCSGHGGVARFR